MKNLLIDHLQNLLKASSYKLKAILMLSLSEKLLLTQWAHERGIKVFWIEHDTIGRWLRWNLWLPRLRQLSRLAITITVSELSRTLYLDLGWDPEKVIAISNGVHFPSPPKRGDGQGEGVKGRGVPLRIGCVSRLSPEKGIDILIDAVKEIPSTSLTIIGRGRWAQRINKKTSTHINVIPWVDDLNRFYQSLDLFILPSRTHDPFGLVAAEAMMNGVPVIVTDACGIAGYLQNEHDALVVHANSTEDLRKAIAKVQEPTLRHRLSINGLKTAREKFSVARMVNAYENILQSNA